MMAPDDVSHRTMFAVRTAAEKSGTVLGERQRRGADAMGAEWLSDSWPDAVSMSASIPL